MVALDSPLPIDWNALRVASDGNTHTDEFSAAWQSYLWDGVWNRIRPAFRFENDSFISDDHQWTISASKRANGRVQVFNQNLYNPHTRDTIGLDTTPSLEVDTLDALPVDGIIEPGREWQVVYPDAMGDGCDCVVGVWPARYTRPEKLFRIRKLPENGGDAVFHERIYTPLQIPNWNGSAANVGPTGAALLTTNGDLGIRMRPAKAWYYHSDGSIELLTIAVMVERSSGYTTLTKIVPRWFVEQALAAGSWVWADETTTTYFPDANVETTTVDGSVSKVFGSGLDYNSIRTGAGSASDDSGSIINAFELGTNASGGYVRNRRSIYLFDLTSLTGKTISAADLALNPFSIDTSGASWTARVCGATPLSNTALVSSDYGRTDNTAKDSGGLASGSWSGGAYNSIALLTSAITQGAINKFSVKTEGDRVGTAEITGNSLSIGMLVNSADAGSGKPKLSVTHTPLSTSMVSREMPRGTRRGIMRGAL